MSAGVGWSYCGLLNDITTINPFNASCSKLLVFDGFMTERQSARMSKIKNSGLDQYGKVQSLNRIGG